MPSLTTRQFLELLERSWQGSTAAPNIGFGGLRIPTGPWDPVNTHDLSDTRLTIVDSVDLRGRTIPSSLFWYGIHFRGRVDLRNVTIDGSADLTACVFDEEVFLDDAEVRGSLTLARASAKTFSLRGAIVQGSLDLRGGQGDRLFDLTDMNIDGGCDTRGISAMVVMLRNASVAGDLRIGCGSEGRREAERVKQIDARGSKISGWVRVTGSGAVSKETEGKAIDPTQHDGNIVDEIDGAFRWGTEHRDGSGQTPLNGPDLLFSNASIGGNLQIGPYFGRDYEWRRAPDYYPVVPVSGPDARPHEVRWPVIGCLDLASADVRGDVVLIGCVALRGIKAQRLVVAGDLRVRSGELFVPQSKVGNRWFARQVEIRSEGAPFDALAAESSTIHGVVDIHGARFNGTVSFATATIDSRFTAASFCWPDSEASGAMYTAPTTIAGDLQLNQADLKGAADIRGIKLSGNAECWGARVGGLLRIGPDINERAEIGGDLSMHSATLPQVEFLGVQVRGEIDLRYATISALQMLPDRLQMPPHPRTDANATSDNRDAIVLTQVGLLRMSNTRVSGSVKLLMLQVTGREVFGRRGLRIEDCDVGGSLELFDDDAFVRLYADGVSYAEARRKCPVECRDYSAAIIGGLFVKRTKVGADANLRCVKVDGVIDLEDSSFGGDLNFAPALHSTNVRDSRASELPIGRFPLEHQSRASCHGLKLRMAKCRNDVILSGLTVIDPDEGSAYVGTDRRHGVVDGRFLSVDGDLICFRDNREEDLKASVCFEYAAFVVVARSLDLSYATLSHLVVSGCSFRPRPDAGDSVREDAGLILERAKIGKLEVHEARCFPSAGAEQEPRGAAAYPIPVKLADVSVEVWEIKGSKERDNEDSMYVNFIENDHPFRRSTYRSLENSLRNAGLDDHADRVYHRMRHRDWHDTLRFRGRQLESKLQAIVDSGTRKPGITLALSSVGTALRTACVASWNALLIAIRALGHYSFGALLQYGTNPLRLFMIVVALFLVMLPAYATSSNFEASLEFLAVDRNRFVQGTDVPAYDQSPDSAGWTLTDAVQVGLKNHVPMVALGVRDEWQPRDSGNTSFSLWRRNCVRYEHEIATACIPIAPEDLFNAVQIVNWACWPILLTFAIRRMLRES